MLASLIDLNALLLFNYHSLVTGSNLSQRSAQLEGFTASVTNVQKPCTFLQCYFHYHIAEIKEREEQALKVVRFPYLCTFTANVQRRG